MFFLKEHIKLNPEVTLLWFSATIIWIKFMGKKIITYWIFDSKGYTFGVDYKISNHANIGLEFQYNTNPNHLNSLKF